MIAHRRGWRRLLALQPWDAEVIPIALTAMVLAIAYNPHFSLMVTFALCLMINLALGAGIEPLHRADGRDGGRRAAVDRRAEPHQADPGRCDGGAWLLPADLGDGPLAWISRWPLIANDSLWRAGWGLMAGFFLGGILPFVENAFGIVTGISLLELGDISHPLLQELVRRALGTHNHSVAVATIAESAAERIGANSLLLRVGAYFHDIGKMLKPHYFVENQMGAPNRHCQPGAGDEHAHHHRPRQGRRRPGPSA